MLQCQQTTAVELTKRGRLPANIVQTTPAAFNHFLFNLFLQWRHQHACTSSAEQEKLRLLNTINTNSASILKPTNILRTHTRTQNIVSPLAAYVWTFKTSACYILLKYFSTYPPHTLGIFNGSWLTRIIKTCMWLQKSNGAAKYVYHRACNERVL